ncbi:hypothetical protein Ddye_015381 [Dipteronia dyeriana]|uniref:Uncharacterized protein n=1 Tax=Dipteronia dyeriana TaxID=168575 RepID=A0AAD9U563_9ROSI|nr:hypothetical protein Ddye_015379 [Dipteronia dyeriana]KAK2647892.1 hypothetical protein Ddye_015381 [Dipteronia dyeriana]
MKNEQRLFDNWPSIERAQTEEENEWAQGSDESDGQSDDNSLVMNDSSDEDIVARYCHENQWTPNPNGPIDLKEGHIFRNVKMVKDVVKRAKKRVLKTLTVDHVNSYAKVRKYANTVIAMNRNTNAKVMIDRN